MHFVFWMSMLVVDIFNLTGPGMASGYGISTLHCMTVSLAHGVKNYLLASF